MQIDTTDVKAIFSFTSRTHILVHDVPTGQWAIHERIDRSFKGKDDDITSPIIYLTNEEADALKKSGFTYTERYNDTK